MKYRMGIHSHYAEDGECPRLLDRELWLFDPLLPYPERVLNAFCRKYGWRRSDIHHFKIEYNLDMRKHCMTEMSMEIHE